MSLNGLLNKGGLRRIATATVATPVTDSASTLPSVANVAGVAVANPQKRPANDPASTTATAAPSLPGNDPDWHCWPHTTAMNTRELDIYAVRLERFTGKGLIELDAETLADKLVIRDREKGDRRLCLECVYLTGYGASSWRCSNWQRSGIAIRARDNQLPVDLVLQLQRCDGFANATPNAIANATPNLTTKTPF